MNIGRFFGIKNNREPKNVRGVAFHFEKKQNLKKEEEIMEERENKDRVLSAAKKKAVERAHVSDIYSKTYDVRERSGKVILRKKS
ncbi:MAG: hypothetical protein DRP65_12170 [Planctomycetota bacterium]|nr:MAG: hypothetical protein DRP65_12170 [Planctomycetota bacterium]